MESVEVHFYICRGSEVMDEANGIGGNIEKMRFEAIDHFERNRQLRRLRQTVVGDFVKVLQTPLPFFCGSHPAGKITPAGVVYPAEDPRAGFRAHIDQPFAE